MTKTMSFPIVGAHFRPPAKAILECLPAGSALSLRPEPDNPFDSNAVQVIVQGAVLQGLPAIIQNRLDDLAGMYGSDLASILAATEWHLGYVPRALAISLAPALAGNEIEASLTFSASGAAQATTTIDSTKTD